MLSKESQVEIEVLSRQGKGIRAIARELSISRNTVRTILRGGGAQEYGPRSSRPTKLDPFHEYLRERISSAGQTHLTATVLLREIRELGYAGGVSQLKLSLVKIRPAKPLDPIVRFETDPSDQLQIDFVVFRRGEHPLRAFTASLGYSRMSYVEFVDNERVETWIVCLERAVSWFGGVPKHILCDNPKAIVLERHAYGDGKHRFHPLFHDFVRHYGVRIKLCQPYRAQTKGKVERFHRYLRESFYRPLATRLDSVLVDVPIANREVRPWLDSVCQRSRPCNAQRASDRPIPNGESLAHAVAVTLCWEATQCARRDYQHAACPNAG